MAQNVKAQKGAKRKCSCMSRMASIVIRRRACPLSGQPAGKVGLSQAAVRCGPHPNWQSGTIVELPSRYTTADHMLAVTLLTVIWAYTQRLPSGKTQAASTFVGTNTPACVAISSCMTGPCGLSLRAAQQGVYFKRLSRLLPELPQQALRPNVTACKPVQSATKPAQLTPPARGHSQQAICTQTNSQRALPAAHPTLTQTACGPSTPPAIPPAQSCRPAGAARSRGS